MQIIFLPMLKDIEKSGTVFDSTIRNQC